MVSTLCTIMLPALVAQAFAEDLNLGRQDTGAQDPITQLMEKLQSPVAMDEFTEKLLNRLGVRLAGRTLKTSADQSAVAAAQSDNVMDHAKLDDTTLAKDTVKSLRVQLLEEESAKKAAEAKAANATQKMESSQATAAKAKSAKKAAEAKATQATQKMKAAESQSTQSQSAEAKAAEANAAEAKAAKAAEAKAANATQKMQSAESQEAQARSAQKTAEAKAAQQVRSAESKVAHAEEEKKAAEGRAQSAETEAAQARAAKRAALAKASQEEQAAQAEEAKAQTAETMVANTRDTQKASQMEKSKKASSVSQASVGQKKDLVATAGECCLTQQELVESSTGSALHLVAGCAVVMASASALGFALTKRRNIPDALEGYSVMA